MDEAVCTMIQRVQELALGYPEGRIELQLVGGFNDAHHYSEELFYNIMSEYAYVVACKQTFNCRSETHKCKAHCSFMVRVCATELYVIAASY